MGIDCRRDSVVLLLLPPLERQERRARRVGVEVEGPDLRILIAGRYIVGMREVFESAKAAKGGGGDWGSGGRGRARQVRASETLHDAMKTAAKTPQDRLELATVRGEIDGKEAALQDIDAVEAADPSLRKDAEYLRTLYTGGPQPAEPEGFHERFGWFGDLAKSFGKGETDPAACGDTEPRRSGSVVLGLRWGCSGGRAGDAGGVGAADHGDRVVVPGEVADAVWGGSSGRCRRIVRLMWRGFAGYLSIYVLGSLVLMLHLLPDRAARWGLLLLPLGFGVAVAWPLVCGRRRGGSGGRRWGLHAGRGFFMGAWRVGAVGYGAGLPVLGAGGAS